MEVLEGRVDRLVEVGGESGGGDGVRADRPGDLVELAAEVFTLLVGALCGGWKRGELGVDLDEEFVKLIKVEGAGAVLVVLLEEPVEAPEVVRGLREALPDALGDVAPFSEGELDFFGVLALLPGDGPQEGDQVLSNVVLHSSAVANRVHLTRRCSNQSQVAVGFKSAFVFLCFELLRNFLRKRGLCYRATVR